MRFALCLISGLTILLGAALLRAAQPGAFTIRVVPAITDNYILPGDLPSGEAILHALHLVAAPDQFEPASFVVYAAQPIEQLQVTAGILRNAQGQVLEGALLDIRVVKRWYQRNFGFNTDMSDPRTRFLVPELLLYDDTLVQVRGQENYLRLQSGEYIDVSKPGKLDGFDTPLPEDFPVRDAQQILPVNIATGDNRQFWITVYVPAGAAPGLYATEVTLRSAQQVVTLPLELEVLPFNLSRPRIDYSIYYRGILSDDWPSGSVSSEFKSSSQMLADLRNLRAHGISNPAVYQPLSSGQLDHVLGLRQQAGMDSDKLFYLGTDIVPAPGSIDDAEYRGKLPGRVNQTQKIAADFGIRDVYFYARDEARDNDLVEQFTYWDVVQQAGGRVMAAGWRSESSRPGNFAMTDGREDLFNAMGMLSRQESAQWHAKRKLIYSYQNPTGGEELPETWRRNYGLLLWQYDYDGALPYAWQHSYSNAWNDFDDIYYRDHNFTYPTIDGSIDTLQWEGLRAAVDDSRYLATLLDTLESVQGKTSLHAPAVRRWLRDLRDAPLARQDLQAVREQMIGHILALQGYAPGNDEKPARPPAIENLTIAPIHPDGTAQVSWRTAVRATSRIELRDEQAATSRVFESAALNKQHSMELSELRPGRRYTLQIKSVSRDGSVVTQAAPLDARPDMVLTESALQSVGERDSVTAGIRSAWRASIGIDWQQSLLGWWRFTSAREVASDSAGRDAELTLNSGAVPAAGWFGRGVRLNGAGAYLDANDVRVMKNGRATIEGWFRFRSFAMDNQSNMGIFSGIYQHEYNNHFYFNGTDDYFPVASLLTLGAWHHIALTWDGDTGSARMYVDGRPLRPVVQGVVDDVASIDGLRIGDNTGFFGGLTQRSKGTFDGDVDEIRVWSRVLGPAEIKAAYDANDVRLELEFPKQPGARPDWAVIGANAADQVLVK